MALVKIRDEQGEVGHCSVLAQLPLVSIPHVNESDRAEETQGEESLTLPVNSRQRQDVLVPSQTRLSAGDDLDTEQLTW